MMKEWRRWELDKFSMCAGMLFELSSRQYTNWQPQKLAL